MGGLGAPGGSGPSWGCSGVFRCVLRVLRGIPLVFRNTIVYNSVYYLARLEILLRPVFFNTERFFQ